MTSLAPRRGRQLTAQPRGGPLTDLEDRMGDLIQSFLADPFLAAPVAPAVPVWVPPVDIEETEDSYILEMDLPGVKPEDVNIELRDGNELRITGQYRERERAGTVRRQSRRSGPFEYDVILPGEVDPEKVDATLEYGVLTVRLGKVQPQARRIPVKGGSEAGQVQAAKGAPSQQAKGPETAAAQQQAQGGQRAQGDR